MRTENSVKNVLSGIFTTVILTILGFVSRKVFINNLGTEYLGLNGLLTDVIGMLGLVEGGIGTSITYNLYKPLAERDTPRIIALVKLYKKLYRILAIVVFVLSMILFPFLKIFVKNGQSISYISIVFLIFVIQNIIGYLYAHKWSLINADQKGYALTSINVSFNVILTVVKIFILQVYKNYILFLLVGIVFSLIQNLVMGQIVNKRYPYILTKEKVNIDVQTKNNITKNVKALFLHNIGSYCVFGTDNILIAYFIGVSSVGLYSNYTLITNQLTSLVMPILNGVSESIGNLIATENEQKIYSVFKATFFINFFIFSFCVIFLFNLLEPFIKWWLGEGYLLDRFTLIMILLNFYINGMRKSISIFKEKGGIFVQDKYVPLIEAAVNLVASIIFIQYFGLAGVIIGTTTSTLITVFWNAPRLVYKYIFKKPLLNYFKTYGYFIGTTFVTGYITDIACNILFKGYSFMSLVGRGIVCFVIISVIYFIAFYRTDEFKWVSNILKTILCKFFSKKKIVKGVNVNLQ